MTMNENFESRSKDQNESNVNAQVALLEAPGAVGAIDNDTRFLASVSSTPRQTWMIVPA